jgi:hypothetical protein
MKVHTPSFLFGLAIGAGGATIAPRMRAVALEIATTFFKLGDAIAVQVARRREDVSDLLAEAKARARGQIAQVRRSAPPPGGVVEGSRASSVEA